MGITNKLARRRAENRIRRRTDTARRRQINSEDELEMTLERIGDRVYRTGKKIFDISQARKQEGKRILKGALAHGIGDAARFVTGDPRTQVGSSTRKKRRKR